MSTEIDFVSEFKKYIVKCIDKHYYTNPSSITGGSYYDFYPELYDQKDRSIVDVLRKYGERRALAEQYGNIYKAWLSWDFRKEPYRPPFKFEA